jgi:hypothetical protein
MQAGVSAPRPTHFLCWCKESKQRRHLEYNAACGGWRRQRSLRSSRWCARSRAAGARHGHLCDRSAATANALDAAPPVWRTHEVWCACLFASRLALPRPSVCGASLRSLLPTVSTYGERSEARGAAGSRVPAFRCPSGLAASQHQSGKWGCGAPAARDRAHHRPERSERCLRQPPHAALYSGCFLGLLSLHQQRK